MSTLLAYHNDQAIKDKYLSRVTAHHDADQLIQGFGYWKDGKGCAVGCTIHGSDHMAYEAELGIPVAVARLEDSIFEGLPVDVAREWPGRFLAAIRPGADLSRVTPKFLYWLLTTETVNPGINHELAKDAIAQCAAVIGVWADTGIVDESAAESAAAEWAARSAARSAEWAAEWAAAEWAAEWAARSAARSAESAAEWAESAAEWAARSAEWAAEWAARSAEWAARSAARSAESAAESAAAEWAARSAAAAARSAEWAARSAAESAAAAAAYVLMSDKLVELLAGA